MRYPIIIPIYGYSQDQMIFSDEDKQKIDVAETEIWPYAFYNIDAVMEGRRIPSKMERLGLPHVYGSEIHYGGNSACSPVPVTQLIEHIGRWRSGPDDAQYVVKMKQ